MAARKRARETISYPIVQYFEAPNTAPAETQDSEEDFTNLIIYSILFFFAAAFLFVIINWHLDAKNQPTYTDNSFYPVSLLKLFTLSFITIGVYLAYWFYRNWLYLKVADKSSSMPIARGIFNLFWYYPLYKRLAKDSQQRYLENKVLVKPLAILFASLYLLVNLLDNADYLWLPALVILPLLLAPLANYINHIDTDESAAYAYNSRWLIRHTVLALLMIPIMVLTYGQNLNILPSDSVVAGSKVFDYNIKFLQRKGVFPATEKIIYFYSDAFLDARNDGNGFTHNYVFSYWKDDNAEFQFENEALSSVKKIDVSYAESAAYSGEDEHRFRRKVNTFSVLKHRFVFFNPGVHLQSMQI